MPNDPKKSTPNLNTVDHEKGTVNVPGVGELPLVGPTSGQAYRDLKSKEAQHAEEMQWLFDAMRSTWSCPRCRKIIAMKFGANGMPLPNQPAPILGPDRVMLCPFKRQTHPDPEAPVELCKEPMVKIPTILRTQ